MALDNGQIVQVVYGSTTLTAKVRLLTPDCLLVQFNGAVGVIGHPTSVHLRAMMLECGDAEGVYRDPVAGVPVKVYPIVVHVVRDDHSLCQLQGSPRDWAPGHRGEHPDEIIETPEGVRCPACMMVLTTGRQAQPKPARN